MTTERRPCTTVKRSTFWLSASLILKVRVPACRTKNWENMKVLANNCVSKIEIPEGVTYSGNGVAYNPVLGLFVTVDCVEGISVWNPVSRELMAECDLGPDGDLNMTLLPGNRIAVSHSEPNHWSSVEILSLEEDTFGNSPELDLKVPSLTYPGVIALTPRKSLLVAGSGQMAFNEIFIDWNNLNVLNTRELRVPLPPLREGCGEVRMLCCSPDGKVIRAEYDKHAFSSLTVTKICPSSEQKDQGSKEENEEKKELEQIEMQEEATISYYMLDGEKTKIEHLRGCIHDGQNLIIAEGENIVLLESLTEGSNAHLLVSGLKPVVKGSREEVGLNLNHKGQLMVCDDKEFIKVFEYKCSPRSLQDICRSAIVDAIQTGYSDKVKSMTIPSTLKDYLLYK